MVIFVENRHDIQGICFFLITISISEKDVPFAWTPPPPVPFCPFLADPLPPLTWDVLSGCPLNILLKPILLSVEHDTSGRFAEETDGLPRIQCTSFLAFLFAIHKMLCY